MSKDYIIRTECPFCFKIHNTPATIDQILELDSPSRRPIQKIFPELTPAEREIVISGTCPECWEKYMNI